METNEVAHNEIKQLYSPSKVWVDEIKKNAGLAKYDTLGGYEELAPFKLEILFGTRRSLFKAENSCSIIAWETGRLNKSMDTLVRWCGYADCRAPIRDSAAAEYHTVCPKCLRESFICPDTKETFLNLAIREGLDKSKVQELPITLPEYGMDCATLKQIADRAAQFWLRLGSKADIVIKHAPLDIRAYDTVNYKKGDVYNSARRARNKKAGTLRYSMKNIIKDISYGAELRTRILGALTA